MHRRDKIKLGVGVLLGVLLIAALVVAGNEKLFKGSVTDLRGVAGMARPTIVVNSQYDLKTSLPDSGQITLIDFTASAPVNGDAYLDRFFINYVFTGNSKRIEKVTLNIDNVNYWSENHVLVQDLRGKSLQRSGAWLQPGQSQIMVTVTNPDIAVIRAGKSKKYRLVGEVTSADRIGVSLGQ